MDFLHRRILIFVLAVARRPRLTLLCISLSVAICVSLAILRLTISSDQNKLFSSKVPFFHNYLELTRKFPENEAVYIIVEPNDPNKSGQMTQWMALADQITAKLQTMKETVLDAQ